MCDIKEILSKYNTIAMVGVSNDPTKASTIVMKYMQEYGYKAVSYTHLTLPTKRIV